METVISIPIKDKTLLLNGADVWNLRRFLFYIASMIPLIFWACEPPTYDYIITNNNLNKKEYRFDDPKYKVEYRISARYEWIMEELFSLVILTIKNKNDKIATFKTEGLQLESTNYQYQFDYTNDDYKIGPGKSKRLSLRFRSPYDKFTINNKLMLKSGEKLVFRINSLIIQDDPIPFETIYLVSKNR